MVGAEMGTPDVGKRLLVEDIEVRDGEGKGATEEREETGASKRAVLVRKGKVKGTSSVSRANLPFQDAFGRDHVASLASYYRRARRIARYISS